MKNSRDKQQALEVLFGAFIGYELCLEERQELLMYIIQKFDFNLTTIIQHIEPDVKCGGVTDAIAELMDIRNVLLYGKLTKYC